MSTEDPTSNVVSLKPTEEAAPVSVSELARKLGIDRPVTSVARVAHV
jgi:hypothetical protein